MVNKRNKLIQDRFFKSIYLVCDVIPGYEILDTILKLDDVRRLETSKNKSKAAVI